MMALNALPAAAQIHFIIPGGAGGGWDRTARAVGQALLDTGLRSKVTYQNLSGGGGAKGIAHTIEQGDPNTLLVNSTPIVVRSLQNFLPQTFRDLTPIASVIGDYSTVVVRQQSSYLSLNQLMRDLTADPRGFPIAGGSVVGGTDHIFAALLARAHGLDPGSIKYIPYDAGGKAMAGLLSGEVALLSSGFGEVVDLAEQGWVRILCIAAPSPIPAAPDLPTCSASGAEPLEFVNWRGFFAAPSISPARQRQLETLLARMVDTPEWQRARQRYGWVALYQGSAEFAAMLETQAATLRTLLIELSLLAVERTD